MSLPTINRHLHASPRLFNINTYAAWATGAPIMMLTVELGLSIDLTVFDAVLINKLVRTPKQGSFDVGVVFKMHTERRRV